eukprot:scaffold23059_cov31-Tisochrysis_lutea.AAC.5
MPTQRWPRLSRRPPWRRTISPSTSNYQNSERRLTIYGGPGIAPPSHPSRGKGAPSPRAAISRPDLSLARSTTYEKLLSLLA